MTAPRTTPDDRPPPGLRERKKIKTRRAIRGATYALIEEQGYDATTIEQIADRAEVSPSTVFRYFPTKEDIVVTDAWDPLTTAELRARPEDESWADVLRHVMRKALDQSLAEEPEVTRLRARLGVEVPAVRARMLESTAATALLLREALAERSGLDPDGPELRVFAMSVMGGLMEVSHYWAETGHRDDIRDLVDRALDVLEHGLPAGKP
ncbi:MULTISPECIES: TetR/AcrR family transcriptional regulator [Streptomyces]|uniref:TetR family transcriptional regulator n=1 Tax=Streptomyces koelreuteriae TaxID=2838015 RepID=A0ABX8FQF7_9ACTN|nr:MULTISPECIES: TetR/AcrR family transcriptional regulator [Streptomyces]QWB23366.1 TetR family transcriptional regulator [Streptomyces koelreuteriae]UUA06319.1 TetR/AcrR family transcriptional regulator [Streptomyces koelreuteriae]UUA13947.1 TetR/AcrR family transcriptional regulator [Streptomyces sp. CRCS-T-1]